MNLYFLNEFVMNRSLAWVTVIIVVVGLLGSFSASGRPGREALVQDKAPAETVPKFDRTVLPPPAAEFKGRIGQSYKDSQPEWNPALPLQAPAGAPNVIVIVLDDIGFGRLFLNNAETSTYVTCRRSAVQPEIRRNPVVYRIR